jgi:hypothetical protein
VEAIVADGFHTVFVAWSGANITHGNGISEDIEDVPRAIVGLLHRVAGFTCVGHDFTGTSDDVVTAYARADAAIEQ